MDNDLKELILTDFPFPVASCFKRMLTEEIKLGKGKTSQQKLFLSMLDTFEVLVKFLCVIVMKDYLEKGRYKDKVNNIIMQKMFKKMSLGDWQEILRETLRSYAGREDTLFIPELYPAFFSNGRGGPDVTPLHDLCDSLISVRNRYKGHSYNLEESKYSELYAENRPTLDNIFSECSFLAKYRYVAVIDVKSGIINAYTQLNGSSMTDEYKGININGTVKEGDFLILKNDAANSFLNLTPLSYFNIEYDEDEMYLCLYEENKIKAGIFEMVDYLGILPNSKYIHYKLDKDQDDDRTLLMFFTQLFSPILHCADKKEMAESKKVVKKSFNDYYFGVQSGVIDYYTKCFIGREYVFTELDRYISQFGSGYFHIEGVPGQGKTSIICKLIRDRKYIHHLIAKNGGRDNEKKMIQSLYAQIINSMGLNDYNIPDNAEELAVAFGNLLLTYSGYCKEQNRKEVIVIDGLDELNGVENGYKSVYLPEVLPENIYVLISSRPMDADIFSHACNYRLSELSAPEIKSVIRHYFPDMAHHIILQIQKVSDGNPLFLKCILEDLKQKEGVDICRIPTCIEKLFDQLLATLRKPGNETALDIFGLIVIAPEGLSIKAMANILSTGPLDIKRSMEKFSQYFICSEKKYRLFHKRLYEYALGDSDYSYDSLQLRKYHELMINYCEPYKEKQLSYGYRNLPYHYWSAGNYRKIMQLSKDAAFADAFRTLFINAGQLYKKSSDEEKNKITELFDNCIKSGSLQLAACLMDALEELLHSAQYDICVRALPQIRNIFFDKLDNDKKIQYLYEEAILLSFTGQLKESLEVFGRVIPLLDENTDGKNADINSGLHMKVLLEYANTARQYAMPDTALEICHRIKENYSMDLNPNCYLSALNMIGDIYYVRGRFRTSDGVLDTALELARRYDKPLNAADLYRIKGQIRYVLSDYDKAISLFKEALDTYEYYGDRIRLGRIYNNLSFAYIHVDLEKAKSYNAGAMALNKEISARLEYGKGFEALSMIKREEKDYQAAEKAIDEALEIFSRIGYKSGYGQSMHEKAELHFEMGDMEGVIKLADKSSSAFIRQTIPSYPIYFIRNRLLQAEAYKVLGDKEMAGKCCENLPTVEPL